MSTSILNIASGYNNDGIDFRQNSGGESVKRSSSTVSITSVSDATTRSRSSSNESSLGKSKRDSVDCGDDVVNNSLSFSPTNNGSHQTMFTDNFVDFNHDILFSLPDGFGDENIVFKNDDKYRMVFCSSSGCNHAVKCSKSVVKGARAKKTVKSENKNPKKSTAKRQSKSCAPSEKELEVKLEPYDCMTSNETSVKETSSEGSGSSIADTDWLAISKNGADNDNDHQDDNMTSKRRRLSLLVPNPRKPRIAEYSCYVCSEVYEITVVDNPWWSVYVHKCPKCNKHQVPRIDISLEKNSMDNDPNIVALYGEGLEENDGDDDDEQSRDDGEEYVETSVSDEVAKDAHPFDDEGYLQVDDASKLLLLMCHARTCSGSHQNKIHAQVCLSTKYLMLHIRDCNGIDVHGRECKFSWCMPCKAMLRHLTNCYNPDTCKVCNPTALPESYLQLQTLNESIRIKHKDAVSRDLEAGSSI